MLLLKYKHACFNLKENDKVRLLRVQNNSSTKHHSKVLHAVAEHVAAGGFQINR